MRYCCRVHLPSHDVRLQAGVDVRCRKPGRGAAKRTLADLGWKGLLGGESREKMSVGVVIFLEAREVSLVWNLECWAMRAGDGDR